MTEQELKQWFINKFNDCYQVKHIDYPDSIFMFYDPKVTRYIKLCKLSGQTINLTKASGVCLFEQDYDAKYLYIDYDNIYMFIKSNGVPLLTEIKIYIHSWLTECKSDLIGHGESISNLTLKTRDITKLNIHLFDGGLPSDSSTLGPPYRRDKLGDPYKLTLIQ